MVKNILFDLDGTLIDSFTGIQEAINIAIANVKPDNSYHFGKEIIGPPIQQIFQNIMGDVFDEDMQELIQNFRYQYDNISCNNVELFDAVRDGLLELKNRNVNLFIFTNKPEKARIQVLKNLEIDHLFKQCISRDSIVPSFECKSEMLTKLIQHHTLNTEECLVIGDSLEDHNAAKKVNIKFIAVQYGYGNFSNEKSMTRIQDFSSLFHHI
tara:strand:+ start:345 stop:977 length:633 start_codon:yes stop_codon:yes gene_type:complete